MTPTHPQELLGVAIISLYSLDINSWWYKMLSTKINYKYIRAALDSLNDKNDHSNCIHTNISWVENPIGEKRIIYKIP